MKIFIAVISCERDKTHHEQARRTWLSNSEVDYKFILGRECHKQYDDELIVDAGDSLLDLIHKVRRVISYALENDYDYLFKCDIDTYVYIPRLLKSGFEQHEWSGYGEPYGGSGYWINRRIMKFILEKSTFLLGLESEDSYVARNLRSFGLIPFMDPRYNSRTADGPTRDNEIITSHWYAEYGSVRDGRVYDRIISSSERLGLFIKYYNEAKQIGF